MKSRVLMLKNNTINNNYELILILRSFRKT